MAKDKQNKIDSKEEIKEVVEVIPAVESKPDEVVEAKEEKPLAPVAPKVELEKTLRGRLLKGQFAKITITPERGVIAVLDRDDVKTITIAEFLGLVKP